MTPPRTPLALAASLLLLAGAGLLGAPGRLLATSEDNYVPHLDEDGDGLDNALEQRLGSSVESADADGDGIGDLAELIQGTDSDTPDQAGGFVPAERSVLLETYSTGTHLTLQVYAHHTGAIEQVRFHFAREHAEPQQRYFSVPATAFMPYLTRLTVLPASDPSYHVTSARFRIPLNAVSTLGPSFAVAVQVSLDGGIRVADEIRFTTFPQIGLTEVREVITDNGVGGGGTGGAGTGGLFPADPNVPPPPDEVVANQVCVQQLAASGTLGAAGVIYAVEDAYCDSLLEAECPSDCANSTGSTVIGIDIAALIQ